jgi:hypothetical protein
MLGHSRAMNPHRLTRLHFADEHLRDIPCPKEVLRVVRGLGSGLSRSADGRLWAVGDRGPNLAVDLAIGRYGLEGLAEHSSSKAKIMPALDIGPAMAELSIAGDEVGVVQVIVLTGDTGEPLSGLPTPGSRNSRREPALDLAGAPLAPDPGGIDSEGIAAAPDGSFWIGDEYGPSLLRIDGSGRVLMRWVPAGEERTVEGAPYPAEALLPAIATMRQVNRGFEALALSADGRELTLAFQSPLAHPDVAAHAAARHVRLMRLDTETGALIGQWAYPLEEPEQFRRDIAEGGFGRSDVKVSELTRIDDQRLLVLERGSHSTKLFVIRLDTDTALPGEHLSVQTRPTLEELSASGDFALPELDKELLFDSDQHPEISRDLEGMTLLDERTLLLVNDNDFGTEGAATVFWRLEFEDPI